MKRKIPQFFSFDLSLVLAIVDVNSFVNQSLNLFWPIDACEFILHVILQSRVEYSCECCFVPINLRGETVESSCVVYCRTFLLQSYKFSFRVQCFPMVSVEFVELLVEDSFSIEYLIYFVFYLEDIVDVLDVILEVFGKVIIYFPFQVRKSEEYN